MYQPILKRSFELIQHNKRLLIFGFFVALLGNGGAFEAILKSYDDVTNSGERITALFQSFWSFSTSQVNFWKNLSTLASENTSQFFFSLLLLTAILLILGSLIWIVIRSQIILIKNIPEASKKKTISLRDLWRSGKGKFWPVLSVNVFTKIITFTLLFFTGLFLISPFSEGNNIIGSFLVFLLFFTLNILASLILYFLSIYANASIVLHEMSLREALRSGLKLFRKHWICTLEMAFLLFIINLGVSLAGFVIAVVASLPFFLFFVMGLMTQTLWLSTLMGILILITFLLAVIAIGAFLGTFQMSSWVLLFEELSAGRLNTTFIQRFRKWFHKIYDRTSSKTVRK